MNGVVKHIMHLYSIWLNCLENLAPAKWNWKNKHGNAPSMLSIKLGQMTNAFRFCFTKNNSHFFHISFKVIGRRFPYYIILVLCICQFFFLTNTYWNASDFHHFVFYPNNVKWWVKEKQKQNKTNREKKRYSDTMIDKKNRTWKFIFRSNENR